MSIDLTTYLVFLLVMLRMLGLFVANPIFGRANVPTMINVGVSFLITILLFNSMDFPAIAEPNLVEFFLMVVRELGIGILVGLIIRMFLSIMVVGGEIIDMQIGLSMSKNFDPGTNASISLTANLYNAMFVMAFFYTNTHLTLIYLTSQTFRMLPVGGFGINPVVFMYIPEFFSTVLMYAIKLCMPIVVMELIVTMSVGIIMRIIPQINIFVVNIQFKMIIGIFALILLVGPVMALFENLWIICFEQIEYVWTYFLI